MILCRLAERWTSCSNPAQRIPCLNKAEDTCLKDMLGADRVVVEDNKLTGSTSSVSSYETGGENSYIDLLFSCGELPSATIGPLRGAINAKRPQRLDDRQSGR